MARGDMRDGKKAPADFGASPNSKTWKEMAEQAAAELIERDQQLEDAEARLAEIADIAAPDQEERLKRIEQQQQEILELLRSMLDRPAPDPAPQLVEPPRS